MKLIQVEFKVNPEWTADEKFKAEVLSDEIRGRLTYIDDWMVNDLKRKTGVFIAFTVIPEVKCDISGLNWERIQTAVNLILRWPPPYQFE